MNALAKKMTAYLIKNNYIDVKKREEYVYGLEVILGKVINYFTLLFLSAINRNMFETLLFMIVFFSLRKGTGGFHAKSMRNCYMATITIYFLVIEFIVPVFVCNPKLMGIVTVCAVIIIFLVAPVNHPDLNMDIKELKVCRWYSMILAVGVGIVVFALLMLGVITAYIPYIVAGIGMDAGLLLMAKIIKQEVKRKCRK